MSFPSSSDGIFNSSLPYNKWLNPCNLGSVPVKVSLKYLLTVLLSILFISFLWLPWFYEVKMEEKWDPIGF